MEQPRNERSMLRRTLDVLPWVVIALLAAATLWWVIWAGKQPRVHSIWGEPSDTHITWDYAQTRNA